MSGILLKSAASPVMRRSAPSMLRTETRILSSKAFYGSSTLGKDQKQMKFSSSPNLESMPMHVFQTCAGYLAKNDCSMPDSVVLHLNVLDVVTTDDDDDDDGG
jgi:hypothetical protein